MRTKLAVFGFLFPVVMALDLATKRWALEELSLGPQQLFGGLIPLTLAFNRGAAFGLRIGEDSRWFFVPVTVVALGLLAMLIKQADEKDYLRLVSLSLVVSGAIGNLYDRVRWSRGVVDFIGPVNLGFTDFPIFNVADMSISCGAVALALSFWQEERREKRALGVPATDPVSATDPVPEPEPPTSLS